jgi:hypothetical protein
MGGHWHMCEWERKATEQHDRPLWWDRGWLSVPLFFLSPSLLLPFSSTPRAFCARFGIENHDTEGGRECSRKINEWPGLRLGFCHLWLIDNELFLSDRSIINIYRSDNQLGGNLPTHDNIGRAGLTEGEKEGGNRGRKAEQWRPSIKRTIRRIVSVSVFYLSCLYCSI